MNVVFSWQSGRSGSEWTVSVPPCASIIRRESGRPKPVPDDLYVTNGSKTEDRCSGAIPQPLSETEIIRFECSFHA